MLCVQQVGRPNLAVLRCCCVVHQDLTQGRCLKHNIQGISTCGRVLQVLLDGWQTLCPLIEQLQKSSPPLDNLQHSEAFMKLISSIGML